MKKNKITTKFLALTMVFTTAFSLTGCKNTKPSSDQVIDITEAIKTGDSELFYKSMEKNDKFDHYFEAVKNNTNSGLGAVYVKLNEKAQDITLDLKKGDDSFDIPVTVTSYDVYSAAISEMYSAAIEGPEAFADLPTWLCAAMDKAELTTDTVTFDARVDTSSLKYEFSPNSNFFNKITGGVYRFMDTTMTTCTSDDYATCLIAKGDDVIFSVDYYYTSVEEYGLSEEEIQQVIKSISDEYNGYEGVTADIQYDGKQITEIVLVDYQVANTYDLVSLEILSSSDIDSVSLELTVDALQQDGMTCVTETFGITNDNESE